jgi:hypothetical protein
MAINDNPALSRHALQNLYGESLYLIDEINGNQIHKEKPVISKKTVTVITSAILPQDKENTAYTFLNGILQACKLAVTDVSILSSHADEVNFKYIQDTNQSSLVLMFDIAPGAMGLPVYFPHFQLQQFSGVTYLSAPDLEALQNDKLLKSKLWLCLKQYFSL